MSKTGNIPTSSGQGIIFPATCLSGSECSAGLMVCTRCQLCYGYAVHSSWFILGGSARHFLCATVMEKNGNLNTDERSSHSNV